LGLVTRIPFAVLAAGGTALAGAIGWLARPERPAVAVGAALGAGVAGLFATVAVASFRRIKARGGEGMGYRLVNAFIGLMLARMVGYLTFLGAAVALKAGDPLSVCFGLVGGTLVFQGIEIMHLREMS
jgi:hypothetical protein